MRNVTLPQQDSPADDDQRYARNIRVSASMHQEGAPATSGAARNSVLAASGKLDFGGFIQQPLVLIGGGRPASHNAVLGAMVSQLPAPDSATMYAGSGCLRLSARGGVE
jgi:hypothetical protein